MNIEFKSYFSLQMTDDSRLAYDFVAGDFAGN